MREHNIVEILYKGLAILNTVLAYAGKKVTRWELAGKTGLSPKQVGRYLNTLEALHVPLKRQRGGTEELVSIERDTRRPLRLLPFTTEELTAIAFYTTLSPYVHDPTPLGSLHTVGQKIATFLQADLQHDAQLGEAFLPFAKHYKVHSGPPGTIAGFFTVRRNGGSISVVSCDYPCPPITGDSNHSRIVHM